MKQLSSFIKASGLQKRLFIFTIILSAYCVSYGQVYTTQLSGLNEAIPTSSPGTGTATVTIAGTTMRVQATFSGLVPLTVSGQPSGVTASHIHAATAVAGEGTAGVATPVPTFPGFPSGVTSGTYDRTFDMTLSTSYNPAYITANGGTPLSAFNALYAAINSGKAYFNIHTTAFPAGEIRGFFPPCPTINVSIPDAFALSKGVLPNTVYPAYSPASSLTLAATVSGGSAPYTYTWSNGATSATTTVSPTINTTYTVAVKDQRACPGTASKSITVMDIADGKKGDKIIICHKGSNSITLAVPAVSAHLDHAHSFFAFG